MTTEKLSGPSARRSAVLPRERFADFRDWLVRHQWRIERSLCSAEMLRATRPLTEMSRGRKTIFVYNGHDRENLLVFDEAAELVTQFKGGWL